LREPHVSVGSGDVGEHLFVEHHLAWVVDWDLLIDLQVHG
jgi:hypothetical protein